MIKYDKDAQQMIPTSEILVLGLGGAGANMIDCVIIEGLKGPEILAVNADLRTLQSSSSKKKIQLGPHVTRGLGCGGDPEIGGKAAVESENEIRAAIKGRKIIFLCVGLGGGTGSGASPLITRIAREEGAFTVVFATMPFAFEGTRRRVQAETALNELAVMANALVTFDNGRMAELVLANQGIHEAFAAANSLISESIHAISRIALYPGIVHIGLDDLVTTLSSNRSRCLFGAGRARKEDRVLKALDKALSSPLIDKGKLLKTVDAVLVHICGGPSLTIFESELMMSELTKKINPSAQIFFGVSVDDSLKDEFSVTIISSLPEEQVSVDLIEDQNYEQSAPVAAAPVAPIPLPIEQVVESTPQRAIAPPQQAAPEYIYEEEVTEEVVEVEVPVPPQAKPLSKEVLEPIQPTYDPNELPSVEEPFKKKDIFPEPEAEIDYPPLEIEKKVEEIHAEVTPDPPVKSKTLDTGNNTRRRFAHLFKKQEDTEEEILPEQLPQEDPRIKADLPHKTREWMNLVDQSKITSLKSESLNTSTEPVLVEQPESNKVNQFPDLPSQVPFSSPAEEQLTKESVMEKEELVQPAKVKKKKPSLRKKKKKAAETENIPSTEELLSPRSGMQTQSRPAKLEPEEDLFSNSFSQAELELEGKPKGRFEGESPNVYEGEDLDIPTFLRDLD